MDEVKILRKKLKEKDGKQKEKKPTEEQFSIEFMTTARWIVNAGGLSYEKAPIVFALSQKLWTGVLDLERVPSETSLRKWEDWFGENDRNQLSESLQKRIVNFSSDLSKRRGEEVQHQLTLNSSNEQIVTFCDHQHLEQSTRIPREETLVNLSNSKHYQ